MFTPRVVDLDGMVKSVLGAMLWLSNCQTDLGRQVPHRTAKQSVDAPLLLEEIVEMVRTVEQLVDVEVGTVGPTSTSASTDR